jgi:hypothetical protein
MSRKSSKLFVGMDVHKDSIDIALAESAGEVRHHGQIGGDTAALTRRQSDLPSSVLAIAWKAQLRLCAPFRKLNARALNRNKLVVAVARELAGFVWAIGQQVKPS